jgi:hypothetical protein
MRQIEPHYVDFNTAKWFKEKGFNEQCLTIYQDGEILQLKSTISNSQFMTSRNYSAPEQHVVVEWLRVNYGIWIVVNITIDNRWYCELYNLKDKNIIKYYNSPQEAYSAVFDFIIENNLI